jgi:hypothetical protein
LYWDTVEQTLSARPLTIIDPKAAGRKHLLLVDPFALGNGPMLQSVFPQDDDPPQGQSPRFSED